jgi:EpsI family protein
MIMGLRKTIVFMAALMIAASVSAVALRPTEKLADHGPKVDLEAMIPKRFGEWRVDESIVPLLPAPDVQAQLDKIYNQTLARTYVNSRGQRVMLSIAYGGDQSDAMQVHLPEVCYAAQGFQVKRSSEGTVVLQNRHVPVRRVIATLGNRIEPITYWITLGDRVVNSGIQRKLTQMKFGVAGSIPDGMLVRFSSIGRDADDAYKLHEGFVQEMLLALRPDDRDRIAGRAGTASSL